MVINSVVGQKTDEQIDFKFHLSDPDPLAGSAYGGIIKPGMDNEHRTANEGKRRTPTLSQIIQDHRLPTVIDYCSIDTEGSEWYILENFDMNKHICNMMTIERPNSKLRKKLIKHDYEHLKDHGDHGDEFWLHKSFMKADLARVILRDFARDDY